MYVIGCLFERCLDVGVSQLEEVYCGLGMGRMNAGWSRVVGIGGDRLGEGEVSPLIFSM